MHLVTGGAGFIGSHLVRALNDQGITEILVVDDLEDGSKFRNLRDCQIADYMDKDAFRAEIEGGRFDAPLSVVYHQGACTDTMELNGRYLMDNNFTYSKLLLRYALAQGIPFVYASSASVYGNGRICDRCSFREEPVNERPLNAYGDSKLAFDQHVRSLLGKQAPPSPVVGLRYFNVYGPREMAKGRMASMVHHVHRQIAEFGVAKLFEGTGGYGNGEQQRDFVFVDDVVKANLFFGQAGRPSGIFNVGTGVPHSYNDLAEQIIAFHGHGRIEYIPFDEALWGKYQSYTEADLTALRAAGYDEPFTPLRDGIARSIVAWESVDLERRPRPDRVVR